MKTIEFGADARTMLLQGVRILAKAVSVTLGAGGRNVMIGSDWQGPPHISKDGVTVARAVVMNDPIQEMGARVVREAANKTASEAGDGTTTSTVLTAGMIELGITASQANPSLNMVEYKRGMDAAAKACVEYIKSVAKPVDIDSEDLYKVALISANGDEQIAQTVGKALAAIGKGGVVSVERSGKNTMDIDMVVSDGMEFIQGACSTEFFNDKDRTRCNMKDCFVLVAQGDIVKFAEIIGVLKQVHQYNETMKGQQEPRGLLIIAADVSGEALATLVVNKVKGHFSVCAVRSPGYGDAKKELLSDIATVCGATVINEQNGLTVTSAPLSALGLLKSVTTYKDRTILVSTDANKVQIDARAQLIEAQVEAAKSDGEKEQLSVRLARLRNGVAVLYVGGFTEVEMNERRDRIDDAICATRSALQEGIVGGGGSMYFYCSALPYIGKKEGNAFREGFLMALSTMTIPSVTILKNAGFDPKSVMGEFPQYPNGINVISGQSGNLIEMGIIDPAKVCRVAIETAVSVAGTFLTTECVISPTFQAPAK